MDTLLSYVPEVLAAAGTLWGWRQRVHRNRADAAKAAAAAARAALAKRLEDASELAGRFADILGDTKMEPRLKVMALQTLERERRERGL